MTFQTAAVQLTEPNHEGLHIPLKSIDTILEHLADET